MSEDDKFAHLGSLSISPKTTFHFTPTEIKIIISDFFKARGLKNVEPESVRFNIIQGSRDPKEPSGPVLSGVDVEVKIL